MELKKNDKVKVKLIDKVFDGVVIGTPYNSFTVTDKNCEKEVEVYIKELNIDIPVNLKLLEKI